MNRRLLAGALLLLTLPMAACDPAANATITNNSDTRVCLYNPRTPCGDYNDPGERKEWAVQVCTGDELVTVTLTTPDGEVIYERTATCDEWNDAGNIVIEGTEADGLAVSDNFP